jgi:thioesterase domain-containing protein
MHADNIRRFAEDEPFVLAGHSSGGLMAHAVASYMERTEGAKPAGVVLMDTPPPEEVYNEDWSKAMAAFLSKSEELGGGGEFVWFTATVHYISLNWWDLVPTDLPTLLIKAAPTPEAAAEAAAEGAEPKPSWSLSRQLTTVDVPGDHFTMMQDDAEITAATVGDWIAALPECRKETS